MEEEGKACLAKAARWSCFFFKHPGSWHTNTGLPQPSSGQEVPAKMHSAAPASPSLAIYCQPWRASSPAKANFTLYVEKLFSEVL